MYPISEIDNSTFVFASSVEQLMPKYEDIPPEFKAKSNKWNKLFKKMFFEGLENVRFKPKKGVDSDKAARQIVVIMRSYEPTYEHKEAAVAFLFNEWFEDFEIPANTDSSTR